ncbi:MAG TPA: radical SAM protein [Vicinamibacterales bacterium]|nr:radical SAM protein [Vicinamibacterales bacterium]
MQLQTGTVYGPLNSMRFGHMLGVNLAPSGHKACNFDCTYCQYGPSEARQEGEFPEPARVIEAVDEALQQHSDVDTIVVAGTGEPTLHPAFARIADGLWALRGQRAPHAKLALVSNGSTLNRLDVVYSLSRFDLRCMKLDAGDATTFRVINAPSVPLGRLIADLRFVGGLTVQSRFVRDAARGIDNTTPRAVDAWLEAIERVRPEAVEISALSASPRGGALQPVPPAVLDAIAARVRGLGVEARVLG